MIDFFIFLLLTWFPGIELRGSIPFAISLGWNPISTLVLGVILSSFIYLAGRQFLNKFGELLLAKSRGFERYVSKLRRKNLKTYEYIGLFLFVALPIPGSGVYSGTLLAWLFNLDYTKGFVTVFLGNLVAGVIITSVILGLLSLI